MSGRHRKPTTTGRTVAKVAVTGAIMGVGGVAFAGTANAAPDSDWDRLAQCEASGNWGINTGNGYQGGLQFSPSTWTGHGGGQFAATADKATREQQIVVAERVLASQGWGAWPSCSSKLGLSSAPSQRSVPATPAPAPATPAPVATTTRGPGRSLGRAGRLRRHRCTPRRRREQRHRHPPGRAQRLRRRQVVRLQPGGHAEHRRYREPVAELIAPPGTANGPLTIGEGPVRLCVRQRLITVCGCT